VAEGSKQKIMSKAINSQGYKDLMVYQKAYTCAMKIFKISLDFPKSETYSLTDQVRRYSRSVCTNIGEAYRKRIYPKSFISKLSDSDGVCTETMIHLDFAGDCGYITLRTYESLYDEYTQIGKMLGSMMRSPEKFTIPSLPTATAN
jgi:four helix bundle protein